MSESTSEVPGVGEPPRYVRFLQHLVEEGGYGLDESHALAGVKEWREAEVVGALLRNVKERAPDAVVGRIFTAVNQDGLVVLVGEAGEPENGGDAHANGSTEATSNGAHHVASNGTEITSANGRAPRHRVLTDCHISVCTLDQPVNLGAPDGRNARACDSSRPYPPSATRCWINRTYLGGSPTPGTSLVDSLMATRTHSSRGRRVDGVPHFFGFWNN